MDLFRAIVLGIVQGATETLPISSSAHLMLIPWLVGWPEHSLTFDVALHGGTALAVVVYFWRDWVELVTAFVRGLLSRNPVGEHSARLAWYIIIGSIPAGVAGLLFESTIEESLRTPWLVALLLMGMGLVLLVADRSTSHRRGISEITLLDVLVIGVAQMFALVPGVSRSGVTITAALFRQMSRADAARFSFLLSGPIVIAAFLYKMLGLLRTGLPQGEMLSFVVGIAVAAIVGYGAIRFLLGYLQKSSLNLFIFYRLGFGLLVLGMYFVR